MKLLLYFEAVLDKIIIQSVHIHSKICETAGLRQYLRRKWMIYY